MALTWLQKHLIDGLRIFGVEKDAIVGIVLALPEPEQLEAMMEWMCEHEGATTAQILKKTAEISRSYSREENEL